MIPHLNNGFDGLALLLAVVACVPRLSDRGQASNGASSFALVAAMLGQFVHHRKAGVTGPRPAGRADRSGG